MLHHELLTANNFLLYAAQTYDNKACHSTCEFLEDIKRIKYIKKLITRYVQTGELKERLILNHIIVLNNVFGPYHLTRMLFLKMGDQMKYVKPFLVALSIFPDRIINVGEQNAIVDTDTIPMDQTIVSSLRKLLEEARR